MDITESGPAVVNSRPRHWLLFFAGVTLFIIGPVWYVVQFRLKNLGAPWYVPILSSAGVLLLILSVWRRRGIVRTVILMLFVIVCGFEWFVFAVASRSPAYKGPAQPGRKSSAIRRPARRRLAVHECRTRKRDRDCAGLLSWPMVTVLHGRAE